MVDFISGDFWNILLGVFLILGCFYCFRQKLMTGSVLIMVFFVLSIIKEPVINRLLKISQREVVNISNCAPINHFFKDDELRVDTSKGVFVTSADIGIPKEAILVTKKSATGKTERKYLATTLKPSNLYEAKEL